MVSPLSVWDIIPYSVYIFQFFLVIFFHPPVFSTKRTIRPVEMDNLSSFSQPLVEIVEKPPTENKKETLSCLFAAALDKLNFHTVWIFYEEELYMWVW